MPFAFCHFPNSSQLSSTWLSFTQFESVWLNLTQLDSTWLSLTQLNSAWLSLTQLNSAQLSSTQFNSAWLSLAQLDSARPSVKGRWIWPRPGIGDKWLLLHSSWFMAGWENNPKSSFLFNLKYNSIVVLILFCLSHLSVADTCKLIFAHRYSVDV